MLSRGSIEEPSACSPYSCVLTTIVTCFEACSQPLRVRVSDWRNLVAGEQFGSTGFGVGGGDGRTSTEITTMIITDNVPDNLIIAIITCFQHYQPSSGSSLHL